MVNPNRRETKCSSIIERKRSTGHEHDCAGRGTGAGRPSNAGALFTCATHGLERRSNRPARGRSYRCFLRRHLRRFGAGAHESASRRLPPNVKACAFWLALKPSGRDDGTWQTCNLDKCLDRRKQMKVRLSQKSVTATISRLWESTRFENIFWCSTTETTVASRWHDSNIRNTANCTVNSRCTSCTKVLLSLKVAFLPTSARTVAAAHITVTSFHYRCKGHASRRDQCCRPS